MARSGMTALIEELRSLTEAATAEYTLGTTSYWSDNALQDVLDIHRLDLRFTQLKPYPNTVQGGTLVWLDYLSQYGYLEQTTAGTAILYLQDSSGATLGTALWNADYRRGMFTFVNSAGGTSIYMTGRHYDMNGAAADLWRRKAAHYAPSSFDFSTDNHSISRAQVYDHAIAMAEFFGNMSGEALDVVQRFRSDM